MGAKNIIKTKHEMLKIISTYYGFFFQTIIKSEEIELTNSEKEKLQSLIDERDYFSIKEFIDKSKQ